MANIDYKELYKLQDQVLKVVFSVENEFYLTGGTCLSRFYIEKRYSDDLDFFTNQSPRYAFAIKNIKKALNDNFNLRVLVEAKHFARLRINHLLQVDFINDVLFRYKEPIINKDNYLIDNIDNILSNKLLAIIGRDNPKDIFDIYLIWKFYKINWLDIFIAAKQKAHFLNEDLITRLKTFPKELLNKIKLTDQEFLNNFDQEFGLLLNEIILISDDLEV